MSLTPAALVATFDSTNLRLDATDADLLKLADEAATHHFAAVMLYPTGVSLVAPRLKGTGVKIGTVIGFPSGRFTTAAKAAEIDAVCAAGANEVDIVLNYAALREGHLRQAAMEIALLTTQAHSLGAKVKVIVETCYLTAEQRLAALRLCEDAEVDFIKTSTGFGSGGAKVEHLREWAEHRRGKIQLKASGGIKTLADARALIDAGAARLGTSSAMAILTELTGGKPTVAAGSGY
jgi:deoxyribose-phosphate aldolase